MAVERAAGGTSLIDVLDRVLDKGIVIDAWVRVSLVGIDLITVEARVVVASIDTYLKYSEAVGQVAPVSRPQAELAQNVWLRTRRYAQSSPRRKASRRHAAAAEDRPRGNRCIGPPCRQCSFPASRWTRNSRWPSFCSPAPISRGRFAGDRLAGAAHRRDAGGHLRRRPWHLQLLPSPNTACQRLGRRRRDHPRRRRRIRWPDPRSPSRDVLLASASRVSCPDRWHLFPRDSAADRGGSDSVTGSC